MFNTPTPVFPLSAFLCLIPCLFPLGLRQRRKKASYAKQSTPPFSCL